MGLLYTVYNITRCRMIAILPTVKELSHDLVRLEAGGGGGGWGGGGRLQRPIIFVPDSTSSLHAPARYLITALIGATFATRGGGGGRVTLVSPCPIGLTRRQTLPASDPP